MFSRLKSVWAEQEFTRRIVEEFSSMLESSEEMLTYALKVIINKSKGKKSEKKIYIKDQKINITEQEIRKRVLIHLSIQPQSNIPACLALISITKDAERLGDYIKNIFELNTMIRDRDGGDKLFRTLFEDIGDEVLALLKTVKTAFNDSDSKLALEAANNGREISKRCENIIVELVDSDYSAAMTVTLTLGSRYFKRIALHLSNIASSIFIPLPEMDYIDGEIKDSHGE
ncbi:MAG: hypothetical protein J7M24_06800 [Candidatus Latescibacteria bacterium]|nr:hypothetical protein [Candidatus Latescibacterota bacterium]